MTEHKDAMPQPAAALTPTRFPLATVRRAAYLAVLILVGLRAASEVGMMRAHGPDAQMAIWQMELIVKLLLWLAGGTLVVGLLIRAWPRRWLSRLGVALLLIWSVAIGRAAWQYDDARRALLDAASSQTPPVRLAELVHYGGIQAGYELDNRLAKNRATPPAALRELSARVDQQGTQTLLAQNPNTPADVLPTLRTQ